MAYVTLDDYIDLYGDYDLSYERFTPLSAQADRLADINTTGIDGVKKLKIAFPTDTDDAAAVKLAILQAIRTLKMIEDTERSMISGGDGERAVASASSGSESVTYVSGGTSIHAMVSDATFRSHELNRIIRSGFTGIKDKNGVNLLYMGVYPNV